MENKKQIELYDENGKINEEFFNKAQQQETVDTVTEQPVKVAMPKEKMAKKKFKLVKDKKRRIIAGTLSILVLAGVIVLCFKSCSKNKASNNTVSYTDEELKTIYIDKETYLNNVQTLTEYLNGYGNKNIKPVDVNSFYYLANMDNIKSSVFEELVDEGYLPESETDIIISALGIMDDLRDKIALDGIAGKEASFDYSKMFVNTRTAKVFSAAQDLYNDVVKTSQGDTRDSILDDNDKNKSIKEQLTKLGEMEDNYELGENTLDLNIQEFGTLSPAEQVIYNNIQAKTYDILLANYGVSVGGKARDNRIEDISNLVVSLREEFACLTNETDKTYTK